jgi:demethylmenaquinone methyltransferase/2-methoxy-6-polyprenyl-1,4-benzoquinol methylase
VAPRRGEAILDMAGGTGDIAFRIAASGAQVTSPTSIRDAAGRCRRRRTRGIEGLLWAEENAEQLSFPTRASMPTRSRSASGTSPISTRRWRSASRAEARRALLLPGILDHRWPGFRELYDAYSAPVVPRLGKAVAQDEASYRYLVESIRRFPRMHEFKAMIDRAGFARVRSSRSSGGRCRDP